MIVTCPCGTRCRVPRRLTARLRCGQCKREFTPADLAKAVPEPTPVLQRLPDDDFELDIEDDDWDEDE